MNVKKITNFINIISYIIFLIICFRTAGPTSVGLFSSAFVIIYFMYLFFSGSLKITISKMVATRFKRGFNENAKKVFKYSLMYTLFVSALVIIAGLFAGSGITKLLYKDTYGGDIFFILGVFYLIYALSENIKGYYYGCGGSFILVLSDIIKDIVLIIVGPFIIKYINDYGTKIAALKNINIINGVYGAIGISVSMIISFAVLTLILIFGIGTLSKQDSFSFNEVRSKDGLNAFVRSFIPAAVKIMKEIIFPALPIILCSIMYLRSNFTVNSNSEDVYITFSYFAIITSIIIVLINYFFDDYCELEYVKIRTDYKKDDRKSVVSDFTYFIKAALVTVVPIAVTVICYSGFLCNKVLLCSDDTSKKICIICGFALLLSLLDKLLITVLKASGIDMGVLIGNFSATAVELIFLLALSKNILKINSAAIALLLFYFIAIIIHGIITFSNVGIKINDLLVKVVKVVIALIPMLVLDIILAKFVSMNIIIGFVCILIGFIVFYIVLFILGGMSQKDINNMQGSIFYNMFYVLGSIFHVK